MAYDLRSRLSTERCSCGQPLHYPNPDDAVSMDRQVRRFGRTIAVRMERWIWLVPRHYIALHGLPLLRLNELGTVYGWQKRSVPAKRRRQAKVA